jgi:hypothetical protein
MPPISSGTPGGWSGRGDGWAAVLDQGLTRQRGVQVAEQLVEACPAGSKARPVIS